MGLVSRANMSVTYITSTQVGDNLRDRLLSFADFHIGALVNVSLLYFQVKIPFKGQTRYEICGNQPGPGDRDWTPGAESRTQPNMALFSKLKWMLTYEYRSYIYRLYDFWDIYQIVYMNTDHY